MHDSYASHQSPATSRRSLALVSSGVLVGVALIAGQQSPASVFTADQATAGRAAYQANCASCHAPDLAGRNEAPQLAGANFMITWRNRTTRDLFEYIQGTMPPNAPSLDPAQYLAIATYILQANGAAAGSQAFTPTTAAPIGSVATGLVQTNAAAGAPGAAGAIGGRGGAAPGRGGAGQAAGGRGAAGQPGGRGGAANGGGLGLP